MAKNYAEEYALYKSWMNKLYSGKPYLGEYESGLFADLEKEIGIQEERLEESALESAARRGVLPSDVTGKYMTQAVTEPMARARGALAGKKLEMITGEKKRRHSEALTMAIAEVKRRREEKSGLWGSIGKIAGGAITGGVAGAIGGPGGILGGALLGAAGGSGGIIQGLFNKDDSLTGDYGLDMARIEELIKMLSSGSYSGGYPEI